MNFTGNKDVDYEILYRLKDQDLANTCKVNSYLRSLCKNDTFWFNKTIKRFSEVLGTEEIKYYKKNYGFENWKQYYIDLINYLESYYDGDPKVLQREDILKIDDILDLNTNRFAESIRNGNWKNRINEDFIDLSSYEVSDAISELPLEKQVEIISAFVEDPRFRLNEEFSFINLSKESLDIIFNKKDERSIVAALKYLLVNYYMDDYFFKMENNSIMRKYAK